MEPSQIEFSEFIRAYLAAVQNRLRSYKQIRWRMQRFLRLYGQRTLDQITRRDLSGYIDNRLDEGKNPGTINLEISTLSSAYKFAIRNWEWPLINPVTGLHLKTDEGRLRWLCPEEKQRLFQTATNSRSSPQLHDFITLAVNTGCRKTELLTLAWRNIDLQAGILVIESKNSKSGKRRIIPINHAASQALNSRIKHRDET